jgi:Outer membrane protein beta-barrel family/Carboxypeptidase regulatory-like domain
MHISMNKKISLLIVFALSFFLVEAQNASVTGSVKDTATKVSVKNAVVSLLSPKDSILKAFTRVKEDGTFSLKNVKLGKYLISVSHPTFGEYVEDIEIKTVTEILGPIALTTKSKLLTEVIVKSGSPIRIKGDTTIYTADSFKVSANANVEELLKKMPGIQVDKDGKIKAMGQTVEKVLVDGEEFFGDDPGMAVKNLRADAVKEVQVFDKKSDQAEFTGIDDGKSKKTINLKLKEDKKKGYFGKIDVAGGLLKDKDARFNDNILLSSFKGKRKLSAFLLNGNTGQDGLNWQDEQKYGGNDEQQTMFDEDGGINFSFGAQGNQDEEPRIEAQNGFLTNVNAGLQYSNKWNDKSNLNFTPKYNSQRYNNAKTTYTQNQIKDTSLNTNTSDNVFINRYNVKLKATYEVKLDSANTLKIIAKSNFYHTESIDESFGKTTGYNDDFVNSFEKIITTNSDKQAYGLNVSLKHKFKKARRTFSLTGDWTQLNNNGINILKSKNNVLDTLSLPIIIDVNQQKDYDKVTNNVSSKVVYTEPLTKKLALELAYQLSLNNGTNNQSTLNYNPATTKYDYKIDTLSNNFKQNITQNIPSFRINYSYKKIKANIGAGVSFINFNLTDLSSNKITDRNFTNFSPSANLTYTPKANHSISIKYTGTTKQPTIDQLQPLRNNNDLFNQYIGNPNLKPSFTNSFSLNKFGYNFVKDLWSYQTIMLGLENNSIANNRITNTANGLTKIQPINTNGNLNLNVFAGVGFKQKKINTRFSFNFNTGFNRYVDFVNNAKNISDNTNAGLNININKSKDKKYDISISLGPNYNIQKTTQNSTRNKYLSTTLGVNSTIYYKKVWSINVDYNLDSRQKTAQAPALTYNIINTKLQRTFKKDEYTIYFSARDLLNQNIGLDRNFYGTTFTETRNTRLQRYFMLGFAWNFKNKAAVKK